MCKYDDLLAEYDDRLYIEEHNMENDGLYCDGCVWINRNMPNARKACMLAEEIGHYETSVGDILDQRNPNNIKQENKARKWAYEKMISYEDIINASRDGCHYVWEFAEYLDLDEEFVKDAFKHFGILDI